MYLSLAKLRFRFKSATNPDYVHLFFWNTSNISQSKGKINFDFVRGGGHFANLRGFFSSFVGRGLRFVFNFELGRWNFACHQPYTKTRCKNIFQVIMSTPSTSTTPSKSTSRCTTSRLSFIKNEHLKHVSWTIFEKETHLDRPKPEATLPFYFLHFENFHLLSLPWLGLAGMVGRTSFHPTFFYSRCRFQVLHFIQ